MTGSWARDLEADLLAVKALGRLNSHLAHRAWEFKELRLQDLPRRACVGLEVAWCSHRGRRRA